MRLLASHLSPPRRLSAKVSFFLGWAEVCPGLARSNGQSCQRGKLHAAKPSRGRERSAHDLQLSGFRGDAYGPRAEGRGEVGRAPGWQRKGEKVSEPGTPECGSRRAPDSTGPSPSGHEEGGEDGGVGRCPFLARRLPPAHATCSRGTGRASEEAAPSAQRKVRNQEELRPTGRGVGRRVEGKCGATGSGPGCEV